MYLLCLSLDNGFISLRTERAHNRMYPFKYPLTRFAFTPLACSQTFLLSSCQQAAAIKKQTPLSLATIG